MKVIYNIYFLLFYLTTYSQPPTTFLRGTTILVLKTPDYISIAADSKLTASGFDGTKSDAGHVCKIHLVRDFAYASCGLKKEIGGTFDVDSIITKISKKYTDIEDIYTNALTHIFSEYDKMINVSIIEDQNAISFFSKEEISIVFIGLKNKRPSVYVSQLIYKDGRLTRNDINDSSELSFLKLGYYAEIDSYLLHNRNPLYQGLEIGFESLIKLEADKNPQAVSLPINIIKLTANGFEWIKKSN